MEEHQRELYTHIYFRYYFESRPIIEHCAAFVKRMESNFPRDCDELRSLIRQELIGHFTEPSSN